MNREIKFRGKTVNGNKWVYGDLLHIAGGYIIYHGSQKDCEITTGKHVSVELLHDEISVVVPETVGQFTGLFDENGKEIYEGDILGANGKIIGWVKGGVRGYCYDVVYINHPTGEKRWSLYGTVVEDFNNRIEVISNIHDNPDLIKEE
ncbi:YopX family protein [Bacteroides fragilis]